MASWLRGRLLPGDRAVFWNSRLHANAATPIATTKKVGVVFHIPNVPVGISSLHQSPPGISDPGLRECEGRG